MKWIGKNSLSDTSLSDITSVIAGTGLSGGGTTGDVTLNVNVNHDSLAGFVAAEHVDWASAEVGTTIHASNIPTLNQDTTGTAATAELAAQATILATGRAINGVDFNGSAPITVTAAAGTLSGSELKSTVTGSGLTSVGVITFGEWRGTAVNQAYLTGQSGTNTGDETLSSINALDITEVGTIDSGVWEGTTIKTAYIGDDQVTEDKLANTLLAEIDANTAKVTNVTTNLGISGSTDARTITSSDGDNAVIPVATTSVSGVMSTEIFDAVTANTAKVTNSDQTKADINALDITEVGIISSGQWRGDAIASAYIADDAVTEDKLANALLAEIDANTAKNTASNVYGTTIKILPSDFMGNDDAGVTKAVQFVDEDSSGLKPGNASTELLAFVAIPEGMKITLVDVYASSAFAVDVIEFDVNASVSDISAASIGSGNAGTQINVTDTNSTATNFFMIQVTTTATSSRVFGGLVTIAAQ